MFCKNDYVVYGGHGVCKITDITCKEINGGKTEFYILIPIADERTTVFVPTNCPNRAIKMRKVISYEEADALILLTSNCETEWIENDHVRREHFKSIVAQGNCKDLIRLVKTIHIQKQKLSQQRKKLHTSDDNFMKEAEKQLHEELAFALNINEDQVLPYILNQIEA